MWDKDSVHKRFPFKYTTWLLALLMASLHPTLHDLANSIYPSILLAYLHIFPYSEGLRKTSSTKVHSIKAGNNNSTSGVALRCQNTRGCCFSGFNWRVKKPFKQGKLHITCTTCSGYHYHRVLFTSRANLALVKQPLCFFRRHAVPAERCEALLWGWYPTNASRIWGVKGPNLVGMMMSLVFSDQWIL